MNTFQKIEEEDEDGDDEEYKLQFIQKALKLQQFMMDDSNASEAEEISFGTQQQAKEQDFELKLSTDIIPSQQAENAQNNHQAMRPQTSFGNNTNKLSSSNNDEITKILNSSIKNDNNSTYSNTVKTPTLQYPKQELNQQSNPIDIARPKTANDGIENRIRENKTNQTPIYRINKKKVAQETYFAYRSLSPRNSQSSLNQNSAQFALSKNQNNCGKQLMKLAKEGILNIDLVNQQEMEKQFICQIDKKVLFSKQCPDITKKAMKTAPNFYKNSSKDITNNMMEHFKRNQSGKTISKQSINCVMKSNSLSPPKKAKKNNLPHRLIAVEDAADKSNNLLHQMHHTQSQGKTKEWTQFEKTNSPASLIEQNYMKAMKMMEKKHERHDLVINKEIQFNNQYFTLIRYSGQVKTPIEIEDSEYIHCEMYALAYIAYFIPIAKRQLPYTIELILKSGDLELYASKMEYPNLDNNDFIFFIFDIPIKINYQRGEVKEGVYLNIFSKQQSSFKFRVQSLETLATNATAIGKANHNHHNQNGQKQARNRYGKEYNQDYSDKINSQFYRQQIVQEKATFNEHSLKLLKNTDMQILNIEQEKQDRIDLFLCNRTRDQTKFNDAIEHNIQGVKKFSPQNRKEQMKVQKQEKEVRIIRAQYNKNLNKFQEINREILVIQRKAERKTQLTDSQGRLEVEVRLLKQCFQYRWLQILVLIQIIKVFNATIKAQKVKNSRNANLTSPMMNLNKLIVGYLKKKLGSDKFQRTFTRVRFCLKSRVKAFKPLMVQNASLVAGEFMQQKIKLMMIQSKMIIYYNHILMIQRSYRKLLLLRDNMSVVNLHHWEITLKIMLEDEAKFFDKQWITKPVLVDYKKRLEKNKQKVLSHYVKQVQIQFFSKLKAYQSKLKKLPYSYQIAYSFCSGVFRLYFEKQYQKQVDESFSISNTKRTQEYYIETLKFMVKHNVYTLVNNPITAYEKDKQKQIEIQRKKNIEAMKQKEILLSKQREEEFMQVKIAKSQKKLNIQTYDEQSASSSSSLDSNGDIKKQQQDSQALSKQNKQKEQALALKSKQVMKKNENTPISFQDYMQQEEQKQEEQLMAHKLARGIKEDLTTSGNDQTSPTKLIEDRLKKKIGIKINLNSSNSSMIIDDQVDEDQENSIRQRQTSKFDFKKNSVLFAESDDFSQTPRSSSNRKDKNVQKQTKKDQQQIAESFILNDKKNKINANKKSLKKQVKINENEESMGQENDMENEEEEEYEYEDNENYHEDIDNYLLKHHSNLKKQIKQPPSSLKQKQIPQNKLSSQMEDSMIAHKTSKSKKNDKKEDCNDNDNEDGLSRKKLNKELSGQKSAKKANDGKRSIFNNSKKNNGNSSSDSNQSITSLHQLSQSNITQQTNIVNSIIGMTKQLSNQSISSSILNSNMILDSNNSNQQANKEMFQSSNPLPAALQATTNKSTVKQKSKKKKTKKKKQTNQDEQKLEEIVEGDEATQTFWSNFIHYPIFQSYPNITEMKELVIKLQKKL